MENTIKIFENDEFGQIRTVVIDGEPWFVGKDVAYVLGYSNTKKALSDHVDDEDKLLGDGVTIRDPIGRVQHPTVINESGLYSLILSSKLPRAKEFKHWVTSEILPTIRKTGGYVGDADMFVNTYLPFADEPIKQLFKLQCQYISQLNDRIKREQPLVEFAQQVSDTTNVIDINKMSKLARAENIDIGRNRLYWWLRDRGILMENNIPYQEYIERGYFKVKESIYETRSGKKTYQQTYVTGKGQQFIIKMLKSCYGEIL